MTTINWLHISDWHQDKPNFDRTVVRDELIKDIRERVSRISPDLQHIDFVFFTGDLAHRGTAEQYQVAGAELLDPVLSAVGLGKDRLFVIPGNHDIDETAFEFLPPALQTAFPDEMTAKTWMEEERRFKRLFEPFEAYQNWQANYQPRGFGVAGGTCMVPINGLKVGLMGCNSAWMCRRHKENGTVNDFGFLAVGEQHVYQKLRDIQDADMKIALIHHPFEWLQDFDRVKVQNRFERECHFILRGHEHSNLVQVSNGTSGFGITIRAGACYDGRIPARPIYVNAYNFVNYNLETGKGTVYLRRWSDKRDIWVKDHDTYDDGIYSFMSIATQTSTHQAPISTSSSVQRSYFRLPQNGGEQTPSESLLPPTPGNPVEGATVRIRDARNRVVGTGFLATDDQIWTCAHVVQAALGPRSNATAAPSESEVISLDFPILNGVETLTARVVAWRPKSTPTAAEGLDFAILRLIEKRPEGARPVPLAEDTDLWEHSFRTLGFPKGYPGGVWARGLVLGAMADGRVEIVAESTGHAVDLGFSGGPVWDNLAGGVVGMIVVSDEQQGPRSAAMIPSRALLKARPELRSQVTFPLELQPAGGPYDPTWHISRSEEDEALAHLRSAGTPAVIWGPRSAGKSWLFKALIERLGTMPGDPRVIVEIDLARYDRDERNSFDRLLRGVATRIVKSLQLPMDLVAEAWNPTVDEAPGARMEWLLEERVFPQIEGKQLVLALERADAIWGFDTQDTFFPLLRSWANMNAQPPWNRLRLMMAVSTTPARLAKGRNNSPFNIVKPVDLRDLNANQVADLVRRYGLMLSPQQFNELMELTRGHPFLVRLALFEAAIHQRDLVSVLTDNSPDGAFGWHLEGYRNWLEDQNLLEILCTTVTQPRSRIDSHSEDILHRAGLVEWNDVRRSYQFRYPVFERYFRDRICR